MLYLVIYVRIQTPQPLTLHIKHTLLWRDKKFSSVPDYRCVFSLKTFDNFFFLFQAIP